MTLTDPVSPVSTTLTRAVRVFVEPTSRADGKAPAAHNTYAGFPSSDNFGAWYEFEVSVHGVPERSSGYLATLAELDASVRNGVTEILRTALFSNASAPRPSPAVLMLTMANEVKLILAHRLESLTWNLSPFHTYIWDRTMPQQITLTAVFEFAASHRLNDPTRTPAQNQAFFGKCNKLNGHGHNYHLEVSVAVPMAGQFGMGSLEKVVDENVIERFDHMNLNIDCPEFHSMNPSVEHIAAVCFDLLKAPFSERGVELRTVRLWETSKTSATVEAESPTILG
ncbi:MAG: 6-carboxytetrahydropterin synthase [Phycisphaerales bacterium]|nr:6-carboxytetrahydropterin synthase [Phycisphaerales bacterium]